MKHYMIFSIGPVQDFIATARRSRDLWYGSWMLSELSKAAAKLIANPPLSGELIFPNPENSEDLVVGSKFTSPNKIVAILTDEPDAAAEKVREAVNDRMNILWANAKGYIKGRNYAEKIADEQIKDLIEFYWVSVPCDDSDDQKYSLAREQAEALMAARKSTRDFQQSIWSSNSPKSSLDGGRESVIPGSEYPERGNPNDEKLKKSNEEKIKNLYIRYHARRGEQLSGVDLLKRLGNPSDAPAFKSTSDMAAIPFLQKLDQNGGKGQELLKNIKALLPGDSDTLDRADEGLIFESRLREAFPLQEIPETERRTFHALIGKFSKPYPYYALLRADGDFMGKVIDAQDGKEQHKIISKSLAGFAAEAREIVYGNQGIPIYSGGDDVLAYLPLHTALQCARQLAFAFRGKMNNYTVQSNGKSIVPTLSIGIVIVHHLEPLSDALELVRKAEKDAKTVDGKNGLAIILSKRSGADRPIVDKFDTLYDRLETLIGFFSRDAISSGTAYELQELHHTLSRTNIPPEGKAAEAIRIVARKRESGGEQGIAPDIRASFEKWIKGEKGIEGREDSKPVELDELARELIVANELAGKQEAK